jgi:hypothetical protein
MQDPNQVQTIRERLLQTSPAQLEPTRHQVEQEAERCAPHLFDVQRSSGLDASGRRHMLAAMQQAEDCLRVERGLLPKFGCEE